MPKRTIVAIVGEGSERGECLPVLCYADEVMLAPDERVVEAPELTLEALADFLDQEAEAGGRNASGVHRLLAALLFQKFGRVQARAFMQEIAQYGGLDGLSGADGEGGAFADLGVRKPWHTWSLPDGE